MTVRTGQSPQKNSVDRNMQTVIKPDRLHQQIVNKNPSAIKPIVKKEKRKSHLNVAMENSERSTLLEKLKKYIAVRNYSDNTHDHYMSAVASFLNRLTPELTKDWSGAFIDHLIWMREKEHLAPKAINQHAAAISYFLQEVLELQPGDDMFIRMKTDKALPRVHSKEKVTSILNGPSNLKHRIILMLTYGCGLRLGEVRVLKPEHIDTERNVLWVRKGKGKKDRMVMLDTELILIITDWLKDGCGALLAFFSPAQYLFFVVKCCFIVSSMYLKSVAFEE